MSLQRFIFPVACAVVLSSCSGVLTHNEDARVEAREAKADTSHEISLNSTEGKNENLAVESSVKNPQAKEKGGAQVNARLGKYGCVASKYRNGEYEFIPRGSVILRSGGNYSYQGFEEPSTGTFSTDTDGNIFFNGGYLKDGKAEKTDREGKYLLTFPANPDNRWTMTFVD